MYNEHLIARKTKNMSHSFMATIVLANYNLSFHNIASISIALITIEFLGTPHLLNTIHIANIE